MDFLYIFLVLQQTNYRCKIDKFTDNNHNNTLNNNNAKNIYTDYNYYRFEESLPLLLHLYYLHQGSLGRREDSRCFCSGVQGSPCRGICK